jgi:hypothetical protein
MLPSFEPEVDRCRIRPRVRPNGQKDAVLRLPERILRDRHGLSIPAIAAGRRGYRKLDLASRGNPQRGALRELERYVQELAESHPDHVMRHG